MIFHGRKLKRLVGLTTAVLFFCSTPAQSLPITQALNPQSDTPVSIGRSMLDEGVEIPSQLASIDETFQGRQDDRPFVIHIQNAHASSEAQFQIESLLEFFSATQGIKVALVEGAAEELDPTLLQYFADSGLNRKVNEYLTKQGVISGVQLFLLNNDHGMRIFGIEDAELYKKNLEAFREVLQDDSSIQRFLGQSTAILTQLEQKIFDGDLSDVVARRKAYHERRLDLLAFLDTIKTKAKSILDIELAHPKSQSAWPAMVRIFAIHGLKDSDKTAFELEFQRLESHLTQSGLSENLLSKLRELKQKSLRKDHALTQSGNPRALAEEIYLAGGEQVFSAGSYPEVTNWLAREILGSEIDSRALMNELEQLTARLLEKLTDQTEEKELLELVQDFELISGALKLELNGGEFDRFLERESRLKLESFSGRLELLKQKAGVTSEAIDSSADKIDRLLGAAKRFYEHARLRDEAMTGNIEKIIEHEKLSTVILITGGFHTQGILARLRGKDYSYITLTPRLKGSMELDRANYIAQLMNTRSHLFSRAYLNEVIPDVSDLQSAAAMFPGGQRDLEKMAAARAGAIIEALGELKAPAQILTTFRKSNLLDMEVRQVSERFAVVNGFGAELKIPVEAGRLDVTHASAKKLAESPPVSPRRMPEGISQAPLPGPEEELRDVIGRLSKFDVLKRIDRANLEALRNAITDISSEAESAIQNERLNELTPILARLSSGELGTLSLRSLQNQVPLPTLWTAIRQSPLANALEAFLGPIQNQPGEISPVHQAAKTIEDIREVLPPEPRTIGFDSPELAATQIQPGPTVARIPDVSAVPAPLHQTPNLASYSTAELRGLVYQNFAERFPGYPVTEEGAIHVADLAAKIARRIYGNPFMQELRRREPVQQGTAQEGVPVELEAASAPEEALSYTEGWDEISQKGLARSGGFVVVYDLTQGIGPTEDELRAYLSQLKEEKAENLKIAFLAKTTSGKAAEFNAEVRRVAESLGVMAKQYQTITATNPSEFAQKLSNLHNRLAGYVTEGERQQHISFVMAEPVIEQLKDLKFQGAKTIVHRIDSNAPDALAQHYWVGIGATLYALLLKDELEDPAVQGWLAAFKASGRPGVVHFETALTQEFKARLAAIEHILTSA